MSAVYKGGSRTFDSGWRGLFSKKMKNFVDFFYVDQKAVFWQFFEVFFTKNYIFFLFNNYSHSKLFFFGAKRALRKNLVLVAENARPKIRTCA